MNNPTPLNPTSPTSTSLPPTSPTPTPNPSTLTELTHQFFSRKYECIIPPPDSTIRGRSGQKWRFDMILKFNDQNYGIFVRSWNRSIGVNQIRQLEKACRDTKFAGGLIVGNQFSSNAEIYGENLGIQIVDRATLIRKLQSHL